MPTNSWYRSPECQKLFSETDFGRYMFIWEAILDDGSVLRQFEDIAFERALTDPDFTLPAELRLSTDIIPRDKVVEFALFYTAKTRAVCPWFVGDCLCRLYLHPEKQELLAYWLVDHHIQGGPGVSELVRQVVGWKHKETGKKKLVIISPSGAMSESDTDDGSWEGE